MTLFGFTRRGWTPGAYPKAEADPGGYSMSVPQHRGRVNFFSWDENILDDLEASFSAERLGTYLKAAGGDRARALHLYTWNTAISAAFYGPLQGLEVALRNAMHRRLTAFYGAAWYDNPATGLDTVCLDRLAAAKTEAARNRPGPGATSRRSRALLRVLDFVARSRRPHRSDRSQGELRDDTLEAGAAASIPAPQSPDTQGGPSTTQRPARAAKSNRPS